MEAREILGTYRPREKRVRQAITTLFGRMVRPAEPRVTARERAEAIGAETLRESGVDVFDKGRSSEVVAWRSCVMLALRREGYTLQEIGDALSRNLSTVSQALRTIRGYIEAGDRLAVRAWETVDKIARRI